MTAATFASGDFQSFALSRLEPKLTAAVIEPESRRELNEYLLEIRYLQGAFVVFEDGDSETLKWRPMSRVGLPWWRPRSSGTSSSYSRDNLHLMSRKEIESIDHAFDSAHSEEEKGLASTLQFCTPIEDHFGDDLRAFFFSDGCLSFFAFAFEILRIRDGYHSVTDAEIERHAERLGLAKGPSRPVTPRFARLRTWVSHPEHKHWTCKLRLQDCVSSARKGIVPLGRAVLKTFTTRVELQRNCPFNVAGHALLRSGEQTPRSLLLIQQRTNGRFSVNFYGTFFVEDPQRFSPIANSTSLAPFLALGDLLRTTLTTLREAYEYHERTARLISSGTRWANLAWRLRRGSAVDRVAEAGELVNMIASVDIERYYELRDQLEAGPLEDRARQEYEHLRTNLFGALDAAVNSYFARHDVYLNHARDVETAAQRVLDRLTDGNSDS